MYTAVQAANRQKHVPLNSYVSIYANLTESGDGENRKLLDELTDREQSDPETLFLDKERVAYLEKTIDSELSPFEKQVLDLYLTGMSYSQIAKVLGRDEKSTDNALQRMKTKIRKIL
jgi:RNA polymerase sporulation-specific sigma factor